MIFLKTKQGRVVQIMFKKISTISVLSLALLFSGIVSTPASAAANADQSQDKSYSYKVYYSMNGKWNQSSSDRFNRFLEKCQVKQDRPEKEEQPKEETETPVKEEKEQVKPEQPQEEQTDNDEQVNEDVNEETNEEANEVTNQDEQAGTDEQLSAYEQQVVELTNKEREKQGLSPLKANAELSRVAREKSNDMANNNYFDHNSPQYGSPFDMMKAYGITYRTAGENIARGQQTPEEVVNGWMNSEGHRANILNGDFTEIGVGFVEKGNHWTQQFIGK